MHILYLNYFGYINYPSYINYFIQFITAYLLSDFIMGVYHWIKDTYFSPFTPIIGKKFIWSSRLHHIKPRYILEIPNHKIITDSAMWTAIWMIPCMWFTGLNIFWCTLFSLISLNDVIHKYAHMLDNERPQLITLLQRIKILQTHEEHHVHHTAPHIKNYCPITPYANYPLEKLIFWRNLENLIEYLTSTKPRAYEEAHVEDMLYPAHIKFIRKKLE